MGGTFAFYFQIHAFFRVKISRGSSRRENRPHFFVRRRKNKPQTPTIFLGGNLSSVFLLFSRPNRLMSQENENKSEMDRKIVQHSKTITFIAKL